MVSRRARLRFDGCSQAFLRDDEFGVCRVVLVPARPFPRLYYMRERRFRFGYPASAANGDLGFIFGFSAHKGLSTFAPSLTGALGHSPQAAFSVRDFAGRDFVADGFC